METLLPGTEVIARGLRWEVVTTDPLGPQTLYRLRSLDGPLQGKELDLLHPFEPIEPVVRELRPEQAAPLRNWLVYHQAFLLEQALGSNALLAVQPGRLTLEPYQLVPTLRALRMSRVRLLLADSVGLGKTVQAGLVLTELIARRMAHRILVVSPAGPLMEQWQVEMTERFGLRLETIDRQKLEDVRRSTELGANPYDHIPLGLVSIDFLKQERVLDQLERASYDVVVIDEAHHAMDVGAAEDRDQSQRRRLAEVLARRCDALLLLTATPHDGNDRSFASLCELLDPSLVDGRGALRGDRYRPHVIRRLKKHIIDPVTGEPKFRERVVLPRPVSVVPEKHKAFVELQRGLLDLVAPELKRAFRARRYSDVLAFIALLKRSVSTVAACGGTLSAVAERFAGLLTAGAETQESRRERLRTLREYQRKLERFGTLSTTEEYEHYVLEAEDLAQRLADLQRDVKSGSRSLSRASSVVEALDDLISLAGEAAGHDPKLEQLVEEIHKIRGEEPGANVIVYTEYRDSQDAAVKALRKAGVGEVITMSGEDNNSVRSEVTHRFRAQPNLILVSTDAAAEGLNLHQQCHHLIHLELPFNPNRLEQRNGRIDRYGQTKDPIVRYLYLQGTFEERILLRLIAKYERQRSRLTWMPNTLGLTASTDASSERLLKSLMDQDERLFQVEEPHYDLLELADDTAPDQATQELLEEIDHSLRGFEKAAQSHTWLGDAGLNSEDKLLADADTAYRNGQRVSTVNLARFVTDALLLDGGQVRSEISEQVFEVVLPAAWRHELDQLPGYDPATGAVRLTTQMDLTHDARNRTVGFLGRAHPLVRRALDRVRNLSLGGRTQHVQDNRVSVARAAIDEPALLLTFLGRVSSKAGRELDRVLAVKISRDRTADFYASGDEWIGYANPEKAERTRDVYRDYFADWFTTAEERARDVAREGFAPLADEFRKRREADLYDEQLQQEQWLRQRAEEITGQVRDHVIQVPLFGDGESEISLVRPDWETKTDPAERLAAFATDASQQPRLRSEADGVLRIYRQRRTAIEARAAMNDPELLPLGALMLLPERG